MINTQINPTRMELNRRKQKLLSMEKGHKLLKDKRDELMRQFLIFIKRSRDLRGEVTRLFHNAGMYLALAQCEMSKPGINASLLGFKGAVEFTVSKSKHMSVELPVYKPLDSDLENNRTYSYAFTSHYLDLAIDEIKKLAPVLLELCCAEQSCVILSAELEKTGRRVNALEHFHIPDAKKEIRYIKMKLSENQLSSQVRLMKVKDMMLKRAHNYHY